MRNSLSIFSCTMITFACGMSGRIANRLSDTCRIPYPCILLRVAAMTKVKIILDELTEDEAWALAQMVKRMSWNDFGRLSANESERDDMDNAAIKLRHAPAEAGFDPR
jgi:hypothetical protein